jgi:hypothetical protein
MVQEVQVQSQTNVNAERHHFSNVKIERVQEVHFATSIKIAPYQPPHLDHKGRLRQLRDQTLLGQNKHFNGIFYKEIC